MVVLLGVLTACGFFDGNQMIDQIPTTAARQIPILQVEQNPTLEVKPKSMPTRQIEQVPTVEEKHNLWKLVWRDEFNNHFDKNNWIAEVNDWGGGNQELQYYTDRKENVFVKNGLLNIVGRKERYLTRDFTSARLTSTQSWIYGRFEVRAKLPEGQGIWPSIWLRSAENPYGPWPVSGEIDIMEMLGHEPTTIYGTLHYGFPLPHGEQKQENTSLKDQGFHIFAVEWDMDEIRWYRDGEKFFTVDSWYSSGGNYPAPFDQPFNIVLNLAIGGVWPGNPDESTSFPQKLLIDYVRVYQNQ